MHSVRWLLIVGGWSLLGIRAQTVFTGHTDKVVAAAAHPDSPWVASGSYDNRLIVWRLADGTPRWERTAHAVAVKDVAFSPDGRLLASAGMDKAVKLWDAASGRLLRTLPPHPGGVYAVDFHPTLPQVATACFDGTVRIYDHGQRRLIRQMAHRGRVNDVAFSPHGRWVAAVTGDPFTADSGNLKIWDAETGREIFSWNRPVKELRSVVFTPDGRYLITGGAPSTVYVFTQKEGTWRLLGGLKGFQFGIYSLAVDQEGTFLAVGGGFDRKIYLYALPRFRRVHTFEGHEAKIEGLAFTADGRLVSTSDDNTVRLWTIPRSAHPTQTAPPR